MKFPIITHLQFLAIESILSGINGVEIWEYLLRHNQTKTSSSYYMLMRRLEKTKMIKGKYHIAQRATQGVRERIFTVTPLGIAAYHECMEFYRQRKIF